MSLRKAGFVTNAGDIKMDKLAAVADKLNIGALEKVAQS